MFFLFLFVQTIQPTKIPQPVQPFSLEKAGLNNPKVIEML